MNYFHTLLICLFSTVVAIAQPKNLSTELIAEHSKTFTITNNEIEGTGKAMLEELIQNSQFVTLGESHGSEQISILTKAMLPILADAGFKHFAIEVGPHSAQKLMELSSPANTTVSKLKSFNAAYSVSKGDDTAIPIPFFDSVSDAEFLKVARESGMDLWGLDQEFYFSAMFLTDELANTVKGTDQYERIMQLKGSAQQSMYKYFIAEAQEEIDGVYQYIKKDPAVIAFFEAFDASNEKAQQLISDLKISWDIYIDWRNDSHADRISYINNNFYKHYISASKTEKNPKVFTKIGSLHARKTISNGAYDIGNFTQELAEKNKTRAVSIGTWIPFEYAEDGSVTNNLEKYARSYKRYKLFFPLAKEDSFTIIDLYPLKKQFEKGKLMLPNTGDYHKLRYLLESYDYLIILPTDQEPVPNR